MDTALYDLTPAARLALLGVVIAVVPLAWLWLRHRRTAPADRLRALTLLTLFLTFDLVLFGAFTRLTDSRLARLLWQQQPDRRTRRDPRCAKRDADRSRHARQSLD